MEWAETGLGRASPLGAKQAASNTNPIWCLRSYSYGMRPAHGVHPRHPPRTFPLGLLAPTCLGSLLLLALPACGRVLGQATVWGKEGILPPAPPRLVRPLRGAPSIAGQGSANRRRQPPFSSSPLCLVARFFCQQLRLAAALIQGRGRPSGNVRRREADALAPSLPCARKPAREGQEESRAGLPSSQF